MKIKLIAAALLAVFCLMFAAGCGEEEEIAETVAETTVAKPAATGDEPAEKPAVTYDYEVAGVSFTSETNIEDYISGDDVDMNKLTDSVGYEQTSKANEWTIASNGVRIIVALSEPEDSTYYAVTVSAAHMDGTKDVYTLRYKGNDDDKMLTFKQTKVSQNLVAIAAFALDNAPNADDNNPFEAKFASFKNDKGEYVLTNE